MSDPIMQSYAVKCPKCGHDTLVEVVVNITRKDPFKTVTYHSDLDFAEPKYLGQEDLKGGELDRIECGKCRHVVVKHYDDFRAWVREHGTLLN